MYLASLIIFGVLWINVANGQEDLLYRKRLEDEMLANCFDEGITDRGQCIRMTKKRCKILSSENDQLTNELFACIGRPRCGFRPSHKTNYVMELTNYWEGLKVLKFFVQNFPTKTKLSNEDVWNITERSFQLWDCYLKDLTFARANSVQEANILLSFQRLTHEYYYYTTKEPVDSPWPFDGPGGLLGHAFEPVSETTGNLHGDDDETWFENEDGSGGFPVPKGKGYALFHMLTHEIGHLMGLGHSRSGDDIMKSYYNQEEHESQIDLGPWDINELSRYYTTKECRDKSWQRYYDEKYPDPNRYCKNKYSVNDCYNYGYDECLESSWLKENCAKHCGYCGTCDDEHPQCPSKDNCNFKEGYYVYGCKKTCSYCAQNETEISKHRCQDNYRTCKSDGSRYRCNQPYFVKNCKKHCGLCGSCEDQRPEECKQTIKANHGKCNDDDPWLMANCKTSCNYCSNGNTFNSRELRLKSASNKQSICESGHLDGIFKVGDGKIYIIVNGFIYRHVLVRTEIDGAFKLDISDFGVPGLSNPTAAAYSQSEGVLYLLEGEMIFAVHNFLNVNTRTIRAYLLPKEIQYPRGAFIRQNTDEISVVKAGKVVTISVKDGEVKIVDTQGFFDAFQFSDTVKKIVKNLEKINGIYQTSNHISIFIGSSVYEGKIFNDGKYYFKDSDFKPFMTSTLKC